MTLKEVRESFNISQIIAASTIGVPLRTYIRYECDNDYGDSLKRQSMINLLVDKYEITETKGIYSIQQIKDIVSKVIASKYKEDVEFVYLFGSYTKGYAKENSDVDLCVSTNLSGFKFIGLVESLRNSLHKEVDVIRLSDLSKNVELLNEIMKDGAKIYGQQKDR